MPRAAEKIPIVPMNSSTGIPLSTCTFLNTSSAIGGFGSGAAWPYAGAPPSRQTAIIAMARSSVVGQALGLRPAPSPAFGPVVSTQAPDQGSGAGHGPAPLRGLTTLVSGARNLRQHRLGVGLGELLRFVGVVHGAELGPAHRAERRVLEAFFRQRLVVIGPRGFRVQRQLELLVPVEGEARPRQLVVAIPGARPVPRDVGRMRRDLVRDQPLLHVFAIGQSQVL